MVDNGKFKTKTYSHYLLHDLYGTSHMYTLSLEETWRVNDWWSWEFGIVFLSFLPIWIWYSES